MTKLLLGIISVLFLVSMYSANGTVQNFAVDKSLYHDGDSIKISGKVDYDPAIPFVILQIITPDGSGLVHVANIIPNSDGTFSKSVRAGGPTWSENGKYTIKISYGGNLEKHIDYVESTESATPSKYTKIPPKNTIDDSLATIPIDDLGKYVENPKMRITGFPSYEHSPQYYIDRYNNEPEYQSWFESQFPDHSIEDVVGYPSTHIANFPSFDKSPQYYIDRYNNEPEYQSWFQSQFPNETIYDVLGFSTFIPDWIKTYAQYWSSGQISDQDFIGGLDFMLKNNMIVIPNLDFSEKTSIGEIPQWFRNTAKWWSNDLISQQEFINSIKYLIQEDIILVD